jgi:hypothetical protein
MSAKQSLREILLGPITPPPKQGGGLPPKQVNVTISKESKVIKKDKTPKEVVTHNKSSKMEIEESDSKENQSSKIPSNQKEKERYKSPTSSESDGSDSEISEGEPVRHTKVAQTTTLNSHGKRPRSELEKEDKKDKILSLSKKIKKFNPDISKYELKYIGYPMKLETTPRCKKRYMVEVRYKDQNGKMRKKHVRFGKEGREEFIDHKNPARRMSVVNRISEDSNYLSSNFYKLFLLNSQHNNISDAYKDLVNYLEVNV